MTFRVTLLTDRQTDNQREGKT